MSNKVLVELYRGEHTVSIPPTETGAGEAIKKYRAGDIFEVYPGELETLKDKIRPIRRVGAKECTKLAEPSAPEDLSEVPEKPIPITRLNINNATCKKLAGAGYKTIQQLIEASEEDLKKIRGIGPKRIQYILEDAHRALHIK